MPPPYICDVCHKDFQQKGRYDDHKARKRPCAPNNRLEQLVTERVMEVLSHVGITAPPTAPVAIAKPFLKWVGGKTQIIDDVIALFPKTMVNYHEPFLGGGSVLLALLSQKSTIRVTGKVYASDINANLIALYKHVQTKPDELVAEVTQILSKCPKTLPKKCKDLDEMPGLLTQVSHLLKVGVSEKPVLEGLRTSLSALGTHIREKKPQSLLPKLVTALLEEVHKIKYNRSPLTEAEAIQSPESYYYWIREQYNGGAKGTVKSSAMFLYLNKTCFRGVYREGPHGFNVPFGHYDDPGVVDAAHIREVSALIRDVVFTVAPFAESLAVVGRGDFVYLDPPYAPETSKSFVGYTADGFDLDAHKALFAVCGTFKSRGASMLMSNADVTLVKESFPSPTYTTKTICCRRAIHSTKPDATTNEVFIM